MQFSSVNQAGKVTHTYFPAYSPGIFNFARNSPRISVCVVGRLMRPIGDMVFVLVSLAFTRCTAFACACAACLSASLPRLASLRLRAHFRSSSSSCRPSCRSCLAAPGSSVMRPANRWVSFTGSLPRAIAVRELTRSLTLGTCSAIASHSHPAAPSSMRRGAQFGQAA
jgi:hypothetical protein